MQGETHNPTTIIKHLKNQSLTPLTDAEDKLTPARTQQVNMVEHTGELIHTFRWLMVRAEMQDIEDFVDDVRMACNLPGNIQFRSSCNIESGDNHPHSSPTSTLSSSAPSFLVPSDVPTLSPVSSLRRATERGAVSGECAALGKAGIACGLAVPAGAAHRALDGAREVSARHCGAPG
jgi:hypothetical protein